MPSTAAYPFRRLGVDHSIRGTSHVWWEMNRQFTDPPPLIFQLQTGSTGSPNATDWVDVGTPIVNGFFGLDDERREGNYGKRLLTHYRVKLTTSVAAYVSLPVATYGEMRERDWLLGREIVRKESLRHDFVSREGYLLKRMRFGAICDTCTDPLTGEITDSKCPNCNGVGFLVGYHAPTALTLDMTPDAVVELRGGAEPPGQSRPTDLRGRILGFPQVNAFDIWVDGKSDQRWIIHEVLHLSEWRGIPLIVQVGIKLVPYSDQAYKIEVGGEAAELPGPTLPGSGPGTIQVDHDYCTPDELAYTDLDGNGIVGATILAFTKADYVAGSRDLEHAVASSSTMANGRWSFAMLLCDGEDYVLVFEKTGYFGPTAVEITAQACP